MLVNQVVERDVREREKKIVFLIRNNDDDVEMMMRSSNGMRMMHATMHLVFRLRVERVWVVFFYSEVLKNLAMKYLPLFVISVVLCVIIPTHNALIFQPFYFTSAAFFDTFVQYNILCRPNIWYFMVIILHYDDGISRVIVVRMTSSISSQNIQASLRHQRTPKYNNDFLEAQNENKHQSAPAKFYIHKQEYATDYKFPWRNASRTRMPPELNAFIDFDLPNSVELTNMSRSLFLPDERWLHRRHTRYSTPTSYVAELLYCQTIWESRRYCLMLECNRNSSHFHWIIQIFSGDFRIYCLLHQLVIIYFHACIIKDEIVERMLHFDCDL